VVLVDNKIVWELEILGLTDLIPEMARIPAPKMIAVVMIVFFMT